MWTRFVDNFTGGFEKLDNKEIWIEAPQSVAMEIFKSKLNYDPNNETCGCNDCGEDFRPMQFNFFSHRETAPVFGYGDRKIIGREEFSTASKIY